MLNVGGLDSNGITLTQLSASSNVQVPSVPYQLPNGAAIRVPASFTILVQVPVGVTSFTLSFRGTATASGRTGTFDTGPKSMFVRIPN